jgi:ABC-type antimicrobial peptide transport system permease subunit
MGLTEAARRAGKRLAAKADTLRATTTAASQRAREIGVRMAMGAQRSTVSRMILREAAWLTVIGVLLGLAGALGAARLMGSLLFNVQTWDLPTLASVVLALSVSALAASLLPARRAASVNPIDALRAE